MLDHVVNWSNVIGFSMSGAKPQQVMAYWLSLTGDLNVEEAGIADLILSIDAEGF